MKKIPLKKLKNLNLTFYSDLDQKILVGKVLKITKNGIVSFHHGDNNYFRGGPAGFWEVFYKKNKTGFIIQKLNNKLDDGKIIFKGWFSTKNYFLSNQMNNRFRSNYF